LHLKELSDEERLMSDDNKNNFSPAHLRWIIIGVLGIAFMVIFKDDVSHILKGVEKVSIKSDGITIETRTVDTPLGKTIVSGPPTIETAGITEQTAASYSSPQGYLINWPQDGSWSSRPDMASNYNLDLAIAYNNSLGDFIPNVNVTIEQSPTQSIQEWIDMSNPLFESLGFTVTDVQIDEASSSGVRVINGNFFGTDTNQIQRIILKDGIAYIATATRPTNLVADEALWRDLNNILNSFRVAG
jgi:hypothetical protein